jgi:NAD(P)-dependent dehydrogenase (short-subunit alcohol dehydrogenase family)
LRRTPTDAATDRVKKLIAGNAALTRLADSHLLGLIEPDDIAGTALYLASDESRMVTGQVLPVDSGVTIYRRANGTSVRRRPQELRP